VSLHPASSKAGTDILVIGEALVDLFPDRQVIGGAPFNVARNLAALGAAPLMLTRIGQDTLGEHLADEFDRYGLSQAALQRDDHLPSGQVRVHLLPGGGHRFEIAPGQAWDAIDAEAAVAVVRAHRPRLVCFGTLAQRTRASAEAVRAAVRAAAEGGALCVLDLNLREGPDNRALAEASLPLADVLKLNEDELPQLLHWFMPGADGQALAPLGSTAHEAAVTALLAHFGIGRLVLTLGAEGHAVFDADGGLVARGPAEPVTPRDTVGAGDAFLSVVLLGQLRGWPLAPTLRRAAAFAAAVCGIDGAVSIEPAFYARWRRAWDDEAAGLAADAPPPNRG
jgi:fructokinase